MDETKRHVVDNYPAEKLPDELRGGIDPSHRTRIIVEDISGASPAVPARYLRTFGAARDFDTSVDEAVRRIRTLRDEWEE